MNCEARSPDRRKLISLFPAEQASQLTDISLSQLKNWDKQGLISPAYKGGAPRTPFDSLYSFDDLLALRVLNQLRNEHGVQLKHLREVKDELNIDENFQWCSKQLSVANKKVVITDESDTPTEVLSKQGVIVIPLREVHEKLILDLEKYRNQRNSEDIGKFSKNRNIVQNNEVIKGTRVKVSSIKNFLEEGFSATDILHQFPSLRMGDVRAVKNL